MLLWIRFPRLPNEMWNEIVLRHILSLIGKLYKVYHNSEEFSKGLFARVCVEVDITRSLKRKINYVQEGILYEHLLDYENITSICFGCGSQSYRFNFCTFTSKNVAFKVEKLQRYLKSMILMV